MELKYHQSAYDLLTQTRIDVSRVVEAFDLDEKYQWMQDWTQFDLYQRPATFSEDNIAKLNQLETRYNVKLPASIREWFSLDITPEIMCIWDAQGYPPFPARIEEFVPSPSPYSHLWKFLLAEYIEQGGEYIYFHIDDGDDPSVFAKWGDDYTPSRITFFAVYLSALLVMANTLYLSTIFLYLWRYVTRDAITILAIA